MSILKMDNNKNNSLAVAPIPERLRNNKKIVIITADKNQDLEFFYPYYRLTEAGYSVDVVTAKGGAFEGKHGMGLDESKSIGEVSAEDYELLYLPGGKAPQTLRENEEVLEFVRQFARSGKPIAAICHGPQILISAGLTSGKQMAAWPAVREELEDSGATFIDEALVEDGQFITARMPGDLHRHLAGVLDYLEGRRSVRPRRKAGGAF
jgi:protease I